DTVEAMVKALNEYDFNKQMFRNPNLYALKFANSITDVDLEASNYQIITYSVPFYQLVFSGLIDYSGKSFNTDDKYSYRYHVMKAIETGSNISMTWSYESTVELLETEYSKYYSTLYEYWLDTLKATYNELNNLGVYSETLINHEILTSDGLVTMSTYENGKKIIFNYRDYSYSGNNYIVAANDYYVVEEGV
ncbi:MAG: DUF5696 domain-containing protein, partial [Candidatus Izemoplasmatales bacterium]